MMISTLQTWGVRFGAGQKPKPEPGWIARNVWLCFRRMARSWRRFLLALMNACARFMKAEPWALNNAKQMSKGYDPLSMMKGKNQSKGKGKRKGSYGKKGSSSFGCGWKRDVKGPETRQS